MRHLTWIVTVPITLLAVSFAVSNLDTVTLGLWPLPWRLVLPVYAVAMLALLAGFLLGWAVAAWSGSRARKAAKEAAQRADRLQRELDSVRAATPAAATAAPAETRLPAMVTG